MTILFVCTGNTCRSPLALAAWRALQSRGEAPAAWSAFAAGLAPSRGEAASQYTVEIARGWGIDLSGHRARAVDEGALRQADACVGLTASHARALRQMLRFSSGPAPRVLCLSDFLPRRNEDGSLLRLLDPAGPEHSLSSTEAPEIADPYGGSREAYQECAALVEAAVAGLARALREENPGSSTWPACAPPQAALEGEPPEPS